jgi:hypothetical protein
MKAFTMENETNNITLHPTIQVAEVPARTLKDVGSRLLARALGNAVLDSH